MSAYRFLVPFLIFLGLVLSPKNSKCEGEIYVYNKPPEHSESLELNAYSPFDINNMSEKFYRQPFAFSDSDIVSHGEIITNPEYQALKTSATVLAERGIFYLPSDIIEGFEVVAASAKGQIGDKLKSPLNEGLKRVFGDRDLKLILKPLNQGFYVGIEREF